MTPLLRLEGVSFAYGEGDFALTGLSLAIRRGEKIAVLGPNGAGKSTFFLLCNGVCLPDGGSIFYNGKPVTSKKRDRMLLRQRVGIVFQDPNQQLIGSTVEGEISFGPLNLGLSRREAIRRVEGAMEAMGISPLKGRPPHLLSGGEKKRVTIADALAMEPDILLFDEPTASLDPAGVEMLAEVLAGLSARGKTLLVSTHDLDFAWRWAGRALVFSGGRLAGDGPTQEIFADKPLLARTGLGQPLLYQAGAALKELGLLRGGLPKTVGELTRRMGEGRASPGREQAFSQPERGSP